MLDLLELDVAASSPPTNSVAPVISGTQRMGSVLTTTDGTWSESCTFTYQWQRGGSNISGATASTYTLTNADFGATTAETCIVTATSAATLLTATATSNTLTGVAGNFVTGANNTGLFWICANDSPSLFVIGSVQTAVTDYAMKANPSNPVYIYSYYGG